LTVELERLELQFAKADGADADALDLYSRTAGNLRRLLEAVGLQRRSRDVSSEAIKVEHTHHVVEQAESFTSKLLDLAAKRGGETAAALVSADEAIEDAAE
jgi:hypothetical protein